MQFTDMNRRKIRHYSLAMMKENFGSEQRIEIVQLQDFMISWD